MRILDQNGNVMEFPRPESGRLVPERILIRHHDGAAAVEERWHYETTAVYPNGGRDVRRVIDVPAAAAREPWDEYEDILRYVEYTGEEQAARARARRNALLRQCDWTQMPDAPVTSREAYRVYRQALRDVTKQAGFPGEIRWPTAPEAGV